MKWVSLFLFGVAGLWGVPSSACTQGKHPEAMEAAARALTLFQQAADSCPSPLAVRKLPEELGRTQALAGEAHHGQQQWAEARIIGTKAEPLDQPPTPFYCSDSDVPGPRCFTFH